MFCFEVDGNTQMKEQLNIILPWHPESEKPRLPFVICTNGEGHYWMGQYENKYAMAHWLIAQPIHKYSSDGWIHVDIAIAPLAWCDPTEFVPFEKRREVHQCEGTTEYGSYKCGENEDGTFVCTVFDGMERARFGTEVCPFCGYKVHRE